MTSSAVIPAHGVITGHINQRGCSFTVKGEHGQERYRQVIRSHRYVIVEGDGFTVTKLADQTNPRDCKNGQRYLHCLFPHSR